MDVRYSALPRYRNLFVSFCLILTSILVIPFSEASAASSDSLLPPTTQQILQTSAQADKQEGKALSQSEIIDQATSQSADVHVITKNKDGSVRIPSPMQDVIATLTAKGASFQSVDNAKGDFALYANGLGREKGKLTKIQAGKISSDEKIARLFHNNLIEEFSTSSGGIRQDFVISQSPKGKGKLVLELDLKDATVALDDQGAMLTLEGGRKLAYHSLLVADASGKTLSSHFSIQDKNTLHIIVDDKGAQYPVRIDPTIADAFSFTDQTEVPLYTLMTSSPDIVVSGIDTTVPISVSGGEYSINGGPYITAAGTINNGDSVNVRHTSAATGSTLTNTTLTIGGVSDVFSSTTLFSGATDWEHIGLTGEIINALVETEENGILLAGTNSTLFRSADGGATWIESNTGMGTVNVQVIASYYLPRPGPDTVLYVATDGSGIFKSTDLGVSWIATNTGLTDLYVNALVVDPVNTSTLYAGTNSSGVFKSTDAGANWVAVNNYLTFSNIASLAISPTDPVIIYAGSGDGNGISYSINGGTNWIDDNSGLVYADVDPEYPSVTEIFVDPATPDTFYMKAKYINRGGSGFYKSNSTYSGFRWNRLYSSPAGATALTIDPANPTNIYLATSSSGVFKSNDSGINWAALNSGLSTLDVQELYFTSASILYAGTNGGGVFKHFATNEDTSPNPFLFGNFVGKPINTELTTVARTIAGINVDTEITTNIQGVSNCKYSLNGGSYEYSGIVRNGDVLRVQATTSNRYNTTRNCKIKVGDYITSFTYSTVADDPDQFNFTDQSGAALNATITSDPITLTGLIDSSPIAISGGAYSLNGGTFYTSVYLHDTLAQNGDTITLRHTSADTFSTTTNTTITIAGVSDTFSSTTLTADTPLDTTPDAFAFTDQSGVRVNTTSYSEILSITGINTVAAISITGGEYSINLNAWTAANGYFNAGDTVRVKTTSSSSFSTPVDVVLTIGGISNTFTVTTEADTDGDGIGNTLDTNDDNDGYDDAVDNCILTANNSQLDTDGDNYGNACDADFNNDNNVNSLDLGAFRLAFFTTGSQQADLNGDGFVNSGDLWEFRQLFRKQPGPSGLNP